MDNADRRACRLLDSIEPRLREMWSRMYPASGRDAPRVYRDYSDRSLYACIIGVLGMFGDFLNMSTGERNLVAYQLMGQIGNLIDGAIDAVGDRDPRVVPHVRDQRWERAVLAQFVPSPPCSVCTRFCGRTRIA